MSSVLALHPAVLSQCDAMFGLFDAAKVTILHRIELGQHVDKLLFVRLVLRGDRDFMIPDFYKLLCCFLPSEWGCVLRSATFRRLLVYNGQQLQEYAGCLPLFLFYILLSHERQFLHACKEWDVHCYLRLG